MTESTTESTEDDKPIDGAKIDDKRIGKIMSKYVSKRSHNPNWSYAPKKKQHDDGRHWTPSPPPYRRDP